MMEDDIIPCTDFVDEIERIVFGKDYLISFFTLKKRNVDLPTVRDGSSFCSTLCYYLPKGMAKKILEYSRGWLFTKRGRLNPTAYDYCIGDFLKDNKLKYVLWSPSLVQHMEIKSRIDSRRSSKRQAINFKG